MTSKRTIPTDRERRVLQVLAQSGTPLKSRELGLRAGMFVSEFRAVCTWLLNRGYIRCELKRVKQRIGDARGLKRLAFWSLTDTGSAYFSSLPSAEAGRQSDESVAPSGSLAFAGDAP